MKFRFEALPPRGFIEKSSGHICHLEKLSRQKPTHKRVKTKKKAERYNFYFQIIILSFGELI
jgi:hypothetical protein